MKKTCIFFRICLIFSSLMISFILASCSSEDLPHSQLTDTLSQTQSAVEYCTLSYEEFMQKVSEEMNEDEIVAIVGEPQRIEMVNLPLNPNTSATFPRPCHIYDFKNDNRSIGIVYYFIGEPSEDTARTQILVFGSEDQTT